MNVGKWNPSVRCAHILSRFSAGTPRCPIAPKVLYLFHVLDESPSSAFKRQALQPLARLATPRGGGTQPQIQSDLFLFFTLCCLPKWKSETHTVCPDTVLNDTDCFPISSSRWLPLPHMKPIFIPSLTVNHNLVTKTHNRSVHC